jgi:hypothetical protein
MSTARWHLRRFLSPRRQKRKRRFIRPLLLNSSNRLLPQLRHFRMLNHRPRLPVGPTFICYLNLSLTPWQTSTPVGPSATPARVIRRSSGHCLARQAAIVGALPDRQALTVTLPKVTDHTDP